MNIQRIIITSDLLRISGDINKRDLIAKNTHWLHRILNRPLSFATRKEIRLVEWETGSDFDAHKVYQAFGLEASTENWASLYFEQNIPYEALKYFAAFFKDSLVIGFEISPFIMNVCSKLGLPCINIMWDPIRFMDDIFFSFNTNHSEIFQALLPFQLSEVLIDQSADLIKARYLRKSTKIEVEGTLFFGQTPIDRSLIEHKSIRQLEDFESALRALTTEGKVVFKKHPFDINFERRQSLLEKLQIPLLTQPYNTYDLFCAEGITKVAAISSGTTIEARFFNKAAQTLMPPYYRFYEASTVPSENNCISVFDAFLGVNFWAAILRPVLEQTYSLDQQLPFKPNRMRHANASFWGYQEPSSEQIIEKYN